MRNLLPLLALVAFLGVLATTTAVFVVAAWWAGAGAFAWAPVVVSAILVRRLYTDMLGRVERGQK